jgi:indolepyruvate ferredoxin oxidoreductase
MMRGFRLLSAARGFRGTFADPFRYSADRRLEQRLLADYEETLSLIATNLRADNYLAAVALAEYPEKIRGYGPIKAESAAKAIALATEREVSFRSGAPRLAEAAE